MTIDNTTLIAYVDGELDPASCTELEAQLHHDAALRELVRELQQSTSLIRSAFNHAQYAPVADDLYSTVANTTSLTENTITSFRRDNPLRKRSTGIAIAASISMLFFGGWLGYLIATSSIPNTLPGLASSDAELRSRVFQQTIDKELSGTEVGWQNPDSGNQGAITPLRTFKTKNGRICREFEELIMSDGSSRYENGIACHHSSEGWHIHLRRYPDATQSL